MSRQKERNAVKEFLGLLERDMRGNPEKAIVEFPVSLLQRASRLTEGMDVDLNAELEDDAPD